MNTLIAIIGLGVLCLYLKFRFKKSNYSITNWVTSILGLDISEFNSPAAYYNNMIIVSKFSTAFSGLFIILTIFLVALSHKL
jgi:NADH-quinone oxidoreductase subunit N